MQTQFKKGVLDICVMALIAKRDMYGYEIVSALIEYIDVTESTIYPILRRLTKEGYFTTYIQESNEGPARKYYQLTPSGESHYRTVAKEWQIFTRAVQELLQEEQV
ncbi:MAG: PadR family transcriptional regulator [Culicoidibacterales bacterium]